MRVRDLPVGRDPLDPVELGALEIWGDLALDDAGVVFKSLEQAVVLEGIQVLALWVGRQELLVKQNGN